MDRNCINNINIIHKNNSIPIFSHKDDLKIVYFNIRSLRNKLYDLEIIVNSFTILPDIIILTEIWIKPSENDKYNLANYKSFFVNRTTTQSGGVCIFVKNELSTNEIISEDSLETSWLGIKIMKHNLNIFGIYRSPSSNQEQFLQKFENILSNNSKNIIIGDFNLDLLKQNTTNTKYLEIIENYGHTILNKINKNHPTRLTSSTSTIIDHIITDCFKFSYQLTLSDSSISDHKQITLNVTTTQPINRRQMMTEQTIINYEKIIATNVLSNLQPNNMDAFVSSLQNIIKENTKTIKLRNKYTKRKIWMTTEILLMVKRRDKLYKLKVLHCFNLDIVHQFKKIKIKIQHLIADVKLSHYNAFFIDNKNNPKKMWSGIHELIYNTSKSTESPPQQLRVNNVLITNAESIATSFNQFFTEIGQQRYSFRAPRICKLHNTGFNFEAPNETTIERIIGNLNKKSANGYDGVSVKFIQHFSNILIPKISILIDKFVNEGSFPASLKISKVTPIYKAGDKTFATNFRPIAVQSNLAKIFEQSLKEQFDECLLEHRIINDNQFGFLHNSSTLSACSQLIANIQHQLDRKNSVICIFIDLKKAFDFVNHDLLLYKLRCLGMTDKSYNIFKNFVTERKQFVKIGEKESDLQPIRSGVPQGSILSPSLFNYFINDVFDLKLNGDLQLYADDAVVTCYGADIEKVVRDVNSDLETINEWILDNKLQINAEKTKYLVFKNRTITSHNDIVLNGTTIEEVSTFKYLGLHIDSDLGWKTHIDKVKSSISSMAFAIRRVRNITPEKTLWLMYNAYVLPKLQYLNPIWNGAAQFRMKELQIIQNRVVKSIKRFPYDYPSKLLYTSSTTKSISQISDFQTLIYIYKIKNNFIRHNVELRQIQDVHRYPTRTKEDFYIMQYRTNKGLNNIIAKGLREFNKLPIHIKREEKISVFKNHINSYILT